MLSSLTNQQWIVVDLEELKNFNLPSISALALESLILRELNPTLSDRHKANMI